MHGCDSAHTAGAMGFFCCTKVGARALPHCTGSGSASGRAGGRRRFVFDDNANAHAERFVRTVRSDCLDWLLIFSRRQLECVLREYVDHYNVERPAA